MFIIIVIFVLLSSAINHIHDQKDEHSVMVFCLIKALFLDYSPQTAHFLDTIHK